MDESDLPIVSAGLTHRSPIPDPTPQPSLGDRPQGSPTTARSGARGGAPDEIDFDLPQAAADLPVAAPGARGARPPQHAQRPNDLPLAL
ncbi:MAG TPA: hypothetical protein VEK07_10880, partial [Polyangiaceae bacterium]|nr:hypothetical protein [Polyangiaceae bacterium]